MSEAQPRARHLSRHLSPHHLVQPEAAHGHDFDERGVQPAQRLVAAVWDRKEA
jgi:hypothetical protein